MLDNDTSNLMVEKLSNTERLAGIIIRILKVIGIIIVMYIILQLLFIFLLLPGIEDKFQDNTSEVKTVAISFSCTMNNVKHDIELKSEPNEYFSCNNCDEQLATTIRNLIDYSDLEVSETKISNYFSINSGICE